MPKTTIKVRAKRWDFFNRECKAASLRRDDFLDRALPNEIALLQEIAPCDIEGERWLKKTWIDYGGNADTELHPVPILLSKEVLDQLNSVCTEKRVPRDAFLDCALNYFIERLYEAVLVIKNPRTSHDLLGQIADVLTDPRPELTERDRQRFVEETVQDWCNGRNLEPLSDDYYKNRLSFDVARVTQQKLWFEHLSLDLFNTADPRQKQERSGHDDPDAEGSS